MQSSCRFELSEEFFKTVDDQLARMELIDREPALRLGIRKILNFIKSYLRSILPKPGYPGDKPGLKALRDTISVKVLSYARFLVGMVGYEWGAGSHGHIVEHGHRIAKGGTLTRQSGKGRKGTGSVAGFVAGKFYLQKAVEHTKGQVDAIFRESIQKAIEDTEK